MSRPLVSIITPSYKHGAYIGQAIDSVIAQTYPYVEHIIMDGGSEDNTKAVLEARAGSIKYWESRPDGGQSAALNKALSRASGDIIGWLNADDFYLLTAAATVCRVFEGDRSIQVVYGNCLFVDANSRILSYYVPGSFSASRLFQSCFIAQTAAFFRRDAVEAVGRFDESLKLAVDYDYWLRICSKYPRGFRYIDAPLACFRQHEGSQSTHLGPQSLVEATTARLKVLTAEESASLWNAEWTRSNLDILADLLTDSVADSRGSVAAFLESELGVAGSADEMALEWIRRLGVIGKAPAAKLNHARVESGLRRLASAWRVHNVKDGGGDTSDVATDWVVSVQMRVANRHLLVHGGSYSKVLAALVLLHHPAGLFRPRNVKILLKLAAGRNISKAGGAWIRLMRQLNARMKFGRNLSARNHS